MKLLNFQYRWIEFANLFGFACVVFLFIALAVFSVPAAAQIAQLAAPPPGDLKQLTIEELMNIEVTSVSKVPEKLIDAASAIQVITRQDILRSAATSVPEALRLVPNLQVTQYNSRHWIISARGFNSTFSNKLLVMIDGRAVYSPLFAGVFWDAQSVMLEDIDRIEVISGPGGTLWGANAVNGVINIITKRTAETQGLYASGGTGSALQGFMEARYGGKIGSDLSYRVYGQHNERDHTFLADGTGNTDDWDFSQGGFSLEWGPSDADSLTLQANFYGGKERAVPKLSAIDGQNVMGKWSHIFPGKSNLIVQSYLDRTWRLDIPGTINNELITYDLDLQHSFPLGNNSLLWGLGYRFMNDMTQNSTQFVGFVPADRRMHLFSGFIQDEIVVIPQRFKITIGTKLQHNDFSGFEIQPSARVSFTTRQQQMVWAAVSRAVRTPSRIDVDYHLPVYEVPPENPSVAGGPNFTSEKVIAYELGYHIQSSSGISFSLAGFYNSYDDLYSVEALPGTLTYQIQNGAEGYSYGAEFSGNYLPAKNWRLRGGYTYFLKKLRNKPGNTTDPIALTGLGSDAGNQVVLQSMLDLPGRLQFDVVGRYVDYLPATQFNQRVPSYFILDARIGWMLKKNFEFSLNGQNLLEKRHAEVNTGQIARGVYGKVVLRY